MTEAITWEYIENVMLSEFEHLNLPFSKLLGQKYDGAAYMSCKCNGVKTILVTRHPLSFYTNYGSYRTNLISYSLDNNLYIRKALRVVHDLGVLYEHITFRNVYNTNNNKAKTLKPIFPTRWTAKIMYYNNIRSI